MRPRRPGSSDLFVEDHAMSTTRQQARGHPGGHSDKPLREGESNRIRSRRARLGRRTYGRLHHTEWSCPFRCRPTATAHWVGWGVSSLRAGSFRSASHSSRPIYFPTRGITPRCSEFTDRSELRQPRSNDRRTSRAPRTDGGSGGLTGGRLGATTLALLQGLKELAMTGNSLV